MCNWSLRGDQEAEKILESTMAEKCPKSMTTTKPQMQEAQKITGRTNANML